MDRMETDLLVIGCGLGRTAAAIQAARQGLQVTLITKEIQPEESNTWYAQGGSSIGANWIRPKDWRRTSKPPGPACATRRRCGSSARRVPGWSRSS